MAGPAQSVRLEVVVRFVDLATDALADAREEIDALNVFPVPDGDIARLDAIQASALTAITIAISTMPRPMAKGRSPFDVSRAMAVVMVRVKPSMLPPTIMMAPTSAAARPKPASSVVTRLKRASQISVATH